MTDERNTEEQYLRDVLAQLQESYTKAAKPYVDRLCEIYAYQQPVLRVSLDQTGRPSFDLIEPDEMYEPPSQT